MATNSSTQNWESRSREFRKLLCHISDRLEEKDIQQIQYLRQIAPERSNLHLLIALEKRGEFSPNHPDPLVKLLKDVNRHELAEYVKSKYQAIYPDQESPCDSDIPDYQQAVVSSSVPEKNPFEEDFDRKSIARRQSLSMSRDVRRSRRGSDSGIKISVEMPLEMSFPPINQARLRRPRSRTLSLRSVLSDGSGKKVASSTTSLRYTSELDNSSDAVLKVEHSISAATSAASVDFFVEPFAQSSSRNSQKKHGFSGLKHIFGLRGRKGGASHKRTSKCIWEIDSEVLGSIIQHKGFLKCIKCPKKALIDIGSEEANPYVSLCLYPQGLSDDAEKSMTLQYKVIIPDDCPPISTKATFDLSWEVLARGEQSFRTLESQKQCIQIKFKTGMGYIYKFLSHGHLLEYDFKFLEIGVHISTAYSI